MRPIAARDEITIDYRLWAQGDGWRNAVVLAQDVRGGHRAVGGAGPTVGFHTCVAAEVFGEVDLPAERGQVEAAWETDPPSGRPARHLYRLSGRGARFADEMRAAAATEIPRCPSVRRRGPAGARGGVLMTTRPTAWIVGALAVAVVLSMVSPWPLMGGVASLLAVPIAVVGSILSRRPPKGHAERYIAERLVSAAAAFTGERTSLDGTGAGWGAALRAELAAITVPRERRRFALGAVVALLGRPHRLRSFLLAASVAVAFGAGLLGVSRATLGDDGLGSVTMLGPPVMLFAVGYMCTRSARSLRFGLETGILATVTTLVVVAVVYGIEAALVRPRPQCQRPRRRARRLRLDPSSRPGRGTSGHPSRPPRVLVAVAGVGSVTWARTQRAAAG